MASKIKNSLGIRLLLIAGLTLVLLIPALLIQSLISERQSRRDSAAQEISQKWGDRQTIIGPVLTIPYKHFIENNDGKSVETTRYAHFLPEDLHITGTVDPETRYRGIYEVVVYNSTLSVAGTFGALDFKDLTVPEQDFMVEDASLSLGISDMKGIRDFVNVDWDGRTYQANPGIETHDVLESGISIKPGLDRGIQEHHFKFDLDLNGSFSLLFAPMGKETDAELSSDWADPSFTGNFLPAEREVSETGFRSHWKVLHLNRNFPQQWTGPKYKVAESVFGVDLLLPVDEYQKTMRTAKYAIMFISLTFLTFFMIELLSKKVIHPIQYLLIGFALLIFYTLLLSITEYLLFQYAYLVASAVIIVMISLYSRSFLSQSQQVGLVSGILILLYGYLYVLLQLQDYALLMGSIGLLVVLATVMYLTRNIDWFNVMTAQKYN